MQVASVASPAGDAAASAKALLSILSSRGYISEGL